MSINEVLDELMSCVSDVQKIQNEQMKYVLNLKRKIHEDPGNLDLNELSNEYQKGFMEEEKFWDKTDRLCKIILTNADTPEAHSMVPTADLILTMNNMRRKQSEAARMEIVRLLVMNQKMN